MSMQQLGEVINVVAHWLFLFKQIVDIPMRWYMAARHATFQFGSLVVYSS